MRTPVTPATAPTWPHLMIYTLGKCIYHLERLIEDEKLTQLSSPGGLSVGKGLTVPPGLGNDQIQLLFRRNCCINEFGKPAALSN